MRSLLLAVIALFCCRLCLADCRQHPVTPPGDVRTTGSSVMIVVHESSSYDSRFSTKRGVDEAIRFAKANRIPVIYLEDDTPGEFYFMEDCNPDHWVFSAGGEVSFEVTANHLYIVGGHLELCMNQALHDILLQWARRPPRNYQVTFFMDAIYSNGKMIDPSDPFYHDFDRFLSIVTYGRPGGEHWPKLSLLETMGIIRNQVHQLEYIRQILPRWDRTFSEDYQVEVQMNGSSRKVLRVSEGWYPPSLLFNFVDSALLLAEPHMP